MHLSANDGQAHQSVFMLQSMLQSMVTWSMIRHVMSIRHVHVTVLWGISGGPHPGWQGAEAGDGCVGLDLSGLVVGHQLLQQSSVGVWT